MGKDIDIRRICKNCMDFDKEKNVCTVRYKINEDKTREPMKRQPLQSGCEVFMSAI